MATNNGKRFAIDNLIFFFVSLLVVFLLLKDPRVGIFIENLGAAGDGLSLFLAGFFYSASVTAPAATAAIFFFGKIFNPILIAAIGAFGSLCSDYLLFRFFKTRAKSSVKFLSKKFKPNNNTKKAFEFWAPIIAAIIIASPLPDELGVAILGATNIKIKRFFLISYFLNFLGILAVSWLGSVL